LDVTNLTQVGVFILLVAGVLALFTKWLNKQIDESKRIHDGEHALLKKDVDDIRHKIGNHGGKIDSLTTRSEGHSERLVKLESAVTNIEKSQERLEKSADTINAKLDRVLEANIARDTRTKN
jgi:chromosome segregation ATPase